MAVKLKPEELKKINSNIEDAFLYFRENRIRFNESTSYVYKTTINTARRAALVGLGRPIIEFNITEKYISKLAGEFYDQMPDPEVSTISSDIDPNLLEVIEGSLRQIFDTANSEDFFTYLTYVECLSGGYSAVKILTEYESENSLNQIIKIEKIKDPTLAFFDTNAKTLHKGDGEFCGQLYPMSKSDFKAQYPKENLESIPSPNSMNGMTWNSYGIKEDIVMVAEYFVKNHKKVKIVKLSDGTCSSEDDYKDLLKNWDKTEQPPVVVNQRTADRVRIDRYVMILDRCLEFEETEYTDLPIVFFDGNSKYINNSSESANGKQYTRPYFFNAKGSQDLLNFAGQNIANELENIVQSKMIVEERSIPESSVGDWKKPQQVSTLVWRSTDNLGNELPPPINIQRDNIPSIIPSTFSTMGQVLQDCLGTFDDQIGRINAPQSGIAISKSATQNNSVARPYVANYMISLTHVMKVIVKMIPIYYIEERNIPILTRKGEKKFVSVNNDYFDSASLKYDPSLLKIKVTAGKNYSLQKESSVQQLISLVNALPAVGEMIAQGGLPYIFSNIDMVDQQKMIELSESFTQQNNQKQQQMANQPPPPNPQLMMAQTKQQEAQIKAQEVQAKSQHMQAQSIAKFKELQLQEQQMMIDAINSNKEIELQARKASVESQHTAAQLAMSMEKHAHQHASDFMDRMTPEPETIEKPGEKNEKGN